MGIHYRENDQKVNVKVIIIGVVIIGIIFFSLFVFLLGINSKKIEKINNLEVGEKEREEDDDYLEIVSVGIGKSVNEVENEENLEIEQNNINETISNSTEKIENNNDINKEIVKNTSQKQTESLKEINDKSQEEVKFISPIKGEVMKEFAPDSLIYSETLEEWTTHTGIDIKADKTSVVTAAADGVVSNIKNDPRYGLTVIIKHNGEFETIYANLLTAEFVVEGEEVKAGQTVGTVGNSANFEIADDYHLHFEMLKNGEYVDPLNYIE